MRPTIHSEEERSHIHFISWFLYVQKLTDMPNSLYWKLTLHVWKGWDWICLCLSSPLPIDGPYVDIDDHVVFEGQPVAAVGHGTVHPAEQALRGAAVVATQPHMLGAHARAATVRAKDLCFYLVTDTTDLGLYLVTDTARKQIWISPTLAETGQFWLAERQRIFTDIIHVHHYKVHGRENRVTLWLGVGCVKYQIHPHLTWSWI